MHLQQCSRLASAKVTTMRPRGEFRPPRRAPLPESVMRELRSLMNNKVPEAAKPPASSSSSSTASPAGVFRWLVDVSTWEPTEAEWELLLTLVSEEEAAKVKRFIREVDRKRALVSRLLQRRACVEATGVAWADVKIERTKGGKPFMANKPKSGMPVSTNWNFNVSHEGMYVALAAEPLACCGIDVTEPFVQRKGTVNGTNKDKSMDEQLSVFKDQLTSAERALIDKVRPDEGKMEAAYVLPRASNPQNGLKIRRVEFIRPTIASRACVPPALPNWQVSQVLVTQRSLH